MNEMHTVLKGDNGISYILPTGLEALSRLESFMKEVVYGDHLYHQKVDRPGRCAVMRKSNIGQHLMSLGEYALTYSSNKSYSPILEFFYSEYRGHQVRDFSSSGIGSSQQPTDKMIEVFNDFVLTMRKKATCLNLKAKIADWGGKWRKNKVRIEKMERRLFERYSRLVVIRLDFLYRKAKFTYEQVLSFMDEFGVRRNFDEEFDAGGDVLFDKFGVIDFEEVQLDRRNFTRRITRFSGVSDSMVGYAWRIECTPKAGYHLHFVFFFDGSKVIKHEHLADKIGEFWEKEITSGRGYFHNVNRDRRNHWEKKWALGPIDHWDEARRENLRKEVLGYLCKTRQRVQVLPYKGANLFGTSTLRRVSPKRAGRPRTSRQTV